MVSKGSILPLSPLPDLSKARILISNDDGIHAPGIKVLEKLALQVTDDVWVCAPETEQSATSHSLTISRPGSLETIRRSPFFCGWHAYGFCASRRQSSTARSKARSNYFRYKLWREYGRRCHLFRVLSLPQWEATVIGIRAIAFSQAVKDWRKGPKWDVPERYLPDVLRRIAATEWPENVLVNVNFPDVAPDQISGVEIVRQGKHKLGDEIEEREDPRGKTYFWLNSAVHDEHVAADTDIAVVKRGAISITPLSLDLTYIPMLGDLAKSFA